MSHAPKVIQRLVHDEDGASIVEYALLLALVLIVVIAATTLFGSHISSFFSTAASSI
jgi:pilus assembly protein Flp/PilA